MFLGPAVQSCRNCTLLPVLRHVSVGQTQLSGLEIAVEPRVKLLKVPQNADAFLFTQSIIKLNQNMIQMQNVNHAPLHSC